MSSNSTSTVDPLAAFPHIPVDNTLGAWLIGVCISFLLNGMLFHQAFRYYHNFTKDRMVLKVWVAAVVVLETFTTTLILHTAYFYLVTQYWEPTYFFLQPTVWSLNVLPIPGSLAAFVSQSFFARRVWMIAPKFRLVVSVAMILIFGNVCCFTALSVTMFNSANLTDWLKYSWLATLGSAIQMTGDLTISATLIYVLNTSRTGIAKTDSIVDAIVTYSVSTGVVTCIVHVVNLLFSIKEPDNLIYAAFSCVLTKLYANAFLVALNSRKSLGILGGSNEISQPPTSLGGARGRGPTFGGPVLHTTNSQPTALELKVVTVTETTMDNEELYGQHHSQHAVYKRASRDIDADNILTP